MTLEQLNKFCAPKGFHPGAPWQEGPFKIDKWQVATNGHVLVAAYGSRTMTQLATLENCGNRDLILEWLSMEIPEQKYSTEHLNEFLVNQKVKEPEYGYDPMVFSGYRVDMDYIRRIFSLTDEPYRFQIVPVQGGGRFHFRFSKVIAIVMGMKEQSEFDPRYEPKAIIETVLL